MNESQKELPPEKKPEENGCLPPLLLWGGLAALFFVSKWLESENPGTGKWLFLGTLITGVVGIILRIIIGRSVKETTNNIVTIVKWIAGLVFISFIVGPLTQCSSHDTSAPSEIYFRK
jgi:hypothetical protein